MLNQILKVLVVSFRESHPIFSGDAEHSLYLSHFFEVDSSSIGEKNFLLLALLNKLPRVLV